MTPEIQTLIERLRLQGPAIRVMCDEAANALEQLSSPALPEEVAKMIAGLEGQATFDQFPGCPAGQTWCGAAARLLQRLAGELAEAKATICVERSGCDNALGLMKVASDTTKELALQLAARDAELEVCREALRPFAEYAASLPGVIDGVKRDTDYDGAALYASREMRDYVIRFGHLRAAADALDKLDAKGQVDE